MIKLRQICSVFRKNIVQNLSGDGGGVHQRMYGEGQERLIIIAFDCGFDGELLVGFHIL